MKKWAGGNAGSVRTVLSPSQARNLKDCYKTNHDDFFCCCFFYTISNTARIGCWWSSLYSVRLFQKTCVFELILLSVTVQLRVCLTYFLKSVDFSVRNKSFSPEFSGIKRLYGKLPVAQIRLTLDPGYLCAQSWKLPMMPCFFVNSLVNYFRSHWLDRRECSSDPRVCECLCCRST